MTQQGELSLLEICWWTLVRTVVLCLAAWPLCNSIKSALRQVSAKWRTILLIVLLLPFCFPELLVGYAYRDLAMAHDKWAEALCSALLFVRMVPVGTIALLAAPRSSVDAAAIHCRRLLTRSDRAESHWIELLRCYWHARVVTALPALALMSIVAFQEFELAALLQTTSWTDWFVFAARLNTERGEMFQKALWPLIWQLPVLIAVLLWLRSESSPNRTSEETIDIGQRRVIIGLASILVLASVIVGCVIPLFLIGWRLFEGLGMLLRPGPQLQGLAKEIAISSAIAICAGTTAWGISGRLKGLASVLLLPGLAGSLLLSLGCVALFQLPWLQRFYNTPLPWVLALTVWLLPRAAILRLWLHALQDDQAIYLAQLLGIRRGPSKSQAANPRQPPGRRRLLWHLRDQSQFLAIGLLCGWAYCDLPTAYLLAPTGMASGLVKLYNFMHFGRLASLSAEASVFFGVPVICFFLLLIVNRSWR